MGQDNACNNLEWATEILNEVDNEFVGARHYDCPGAKHASMDMIGNTSPDSGLSIGRVRTVIGRIRMCHSITSWVCLCVCQAFGRPIIIACEKVMASGEPVG